MAAQNLGKMRRGDYKVVQFTLDGTRLPAGGLSNLAKFWFTAKSDVSQTDLEAQWSKVGTPAALGDFTIVTNGDPTATPPVDGVLNCAIQSTDTASMPDYDVTLLWDLQVEDGSGHPTTAASGTLTVQPDVTRAS